MTDTPKDKDQDKADQRRDELAKRVLNTPPQPRHAKPKDKPKPKKEKPAK